MNPRKAVCFLTVLLVVCVAPVLAQGTYTQIDPPGAIASSAWGIDTAGNLTGYWFDASGHPNGFILSGGIYTTIDYPGAQDTYVYGMNDLGQVVGYSDDLGLGFVYDVQTQTFTTINYPGAVVTIPTVINNAGTIAGYFGSASGTVYGFELVGSAYRLIAPPVSKGTFVLGIAGSGALVGYAENRQTSKLFNFSFSHGQYRVIGIPNAPNAQVGGVSEDRTVLVGSYDPPPGFQAGFIYQNQTLTTLQFPGGNNTYAADINGAGEVVGTFVLDGGGGQHGFTWAPAADVTRK
jgi:uncharacterized membrane protein